MDLVNDHQSVERLLEEGAIHVQPMSLAESMEIIGTAERLFMGQITFDPGVAMQIAKLSEGYPYFTQLIGKECVNQANKQKVNAITPEIVALVLRDIKSGRAFPTLESAYQLAIGASPQRQMLLHLLAEQSDDQLAFTDEGGKVMLKNVRRDAQDLDVQYVDQLLPRLVDRNYGPVLTRIPEGQGVYEFVNPVLRLYIRQRSF